MSDLMTLVRNLAADLVAKRLWPVAAVLAIALVAIPAVLLRGGQEPAAMPTVAAAPATGTAPAVGIADERPRGGRGPIGRDPFVQKDLAPKTPSSGAGTSAPAGADPATAAAGVFPGSGTGTTPAGDDSWADVAIPGLDEIDTVPVGGDTGTGTTPAGGTTGSDTTEPADGELDERASWHVDLRFGRDGQMTARTDVARLTPLPSAEDPFFVFLGVLADGKTALFLVSSDAEATGDGKCLPSIASCERVELKAGQTEFFDVTTPEGETVQYQLDLTRVARRTQASTAVAAAARTRESPEGRQVLRAAVDTGQVEVSDLAYSRELGLVLPSGVAPQQGTGLFGGFRVDLRFGAPGALVKRYNLARLTPLPSVDKPSFVYLGVLGDGETALFLNPTEAAASGDAVCLPSPEECQRIELKAGQRGVFSAPTLNGEVEQYELTVDGITRLEAATEAEARAGMTRESPAGRKILRRLITEVGSLVSDLSYSGESGTLVPAPPAAG
jgi:hypothetical protein